MNHVMNIVLTRGTLVPNSSDHHIFNVFNITLRLFYQFKLGLPFKLWKDLKCSASQLTLVFSEALKLILFRKNLEYLVIYMGFHYSINCLTKPNIQRKWNIQILKHIKWACMKIPEKNLHLYRNCLFHCFLLAFVVAHAPLV